MTAVDDGLEIRRANPDDRLAIVDLCRASLGWANGGVDEAFFTWKHDENPAGPSPAWVAVAPDGSLAGLRVFLRWRFRSGSTILRAVRAVDTATHPDWQGRGIFTRLTLGALPDLADDGVDVVFNTPNDQSRPGYLKMGWSLVGRVPVSVRPASVRRLGALAGARVAAEKWSESSAAGVEVGEVLADRGAIAALVAATPRSDVVSSYRDADSLAWRYGFEPLHYRAMPIGSSVSDGVVVFRVRRRGSAREATICDVLVPPHRSARRAFARIARESQADYLICGGHEASRWGFVPTPRIGPKLTWKPILRAGVPEMQELRLPLGDVELF